MNVCMLVTEVTVGPDQEGVFYNALLKDNGFSRCVGTDS